MNCRFCRAPLSHKFAELVNSPLSNAFLTKEQLNESETYFPLTIYACTKCHLVQIDEYKNAREIFNGDYVYFSSYSTSWVAHAKRYVESMISRFGYNQDSLVVEIASNDGYLLQHFNNVGVPVLGVEPTTNTAQVAILKVSRQSRNISRRHLPSNSWNLVKLLIWYWEIMFWRTSLISMIS